MVQYTNSTHIYIILYTNITYRVLNNFFLALPTSARLGEYNINIVGWIANQHPQYFVA